jgi:hypothetical protein
MPAMSTYIVTQNASRFEVRVGDSNGRVVATFSNKLAAEMFAEKQRVRDEGGDYSSRGKATIMTLYSLPEAAVSAISQSMGGGSLREGGSLTRQPFTNGQCGPAQRRALFWINAVQAATSRHRHVPSPPTPLGPQSDPPLTIWPSPPPAPQVLRPCRPASPGVARHLRWTTPARDARGR